MNISSVTSASVAPVSGSGRGVSEHPAAFAAPEIAAENVTQTQSHERVAQAVKLVNDNFVQKWQDIIAMQEINQITGINVVKSRIKTPGSLSVNSRPRP